MQLEAVMKNMGQNETLLLRTTARSVSVGGTPMSANYQGNLHPLLDSVKLSVRKKKKKLSPKSHSTQFSQEPHHYKFDFKK